MTELQRALAGMTPPKVDRRQLQGARYQGSVQQARNVDTTLGEAGGKLLGIMQGVTTLYGNAVDNAWKESERTYQHAVSNGIDPDQAAIEKAKEESSGLMGSILAPVKEAMGLDPLRYSKTVTASNQVRDELFKVDEDVRMRSARGDFKDEAEMFAYRDEQRKATISGVAESIGVDEKNPFYLDSTAKYNEQSIINLRVQQAQVTEQMLIASNKRILNADIHNLITNDVRDPAVFTSLLASSSEAGVLRNDNERLEATYAILQAIAEKGDTNLLNGMLNQEMTFNGQTSRLGDSMEASVRDQILLQSDENALKKNEELWMEYSRQKTNITALSLSGNGAAAQAQLNKLNMWMGQFKGSGQVVSWQRELENLRGQVIETTMRQNAAKQANQQASVQRMANISNMEDRIDAVQNGGLKALDHTAIEGISKEEMDAAFMNKLNAINSNESYTDEQKQTAIYKLASVAPKSSELYAAIQSTHDRGIHDLNAALAGAASSGKAIEMPETTKQLVKRYKDNPTGFQLVSTPEQVAIVGALSEQVDNFGWDAVRDASTKRGLGAEDAKELTTYVDEFKVAHNLTDRQAETLMVGAQAYLPSTRSTSWYSSTSKSDVGAAVQKAWEHQGKGLSVINGTDQVKNTALAAGGDAKTIPIVTKAVDNFVVQLKEKYPNEVFTVSEDADNNLLVQSLPMGYTFRTNANTLYDSAVKTMTQPSVDRMKELDARLKGRITEAEQERERGKKIEGQAITFGPKF